jgi:methyl coenzyme M reductase subunit C-like uncharacterized protein (methanogenesis marker protein 7)
MITTPKEKELLFSIQENSLLLYVNDDLIIPFEDLDAWKKFANDMLGMVAEMSENIETGNY